MRSNYVFCFLWMAVLSPLGAQQPVLWSNPSFEDEPAYSHPPAGWYYCDRAGESPPDIHPGGFFNVNHEAYDGRTYLGMVARDNGTTEGLGQMLATPLQPEQCYELRWQAARSDTYLSVSRSTGDEASFNEPVRLQLWGGFKNCGQQELLAVSDLILSLHWQEYRARIQPKQAYTHLFLEVKHDGTRPPYNGNVLVDHLSPLLPVDCESGVLLADSMYVPPSRPDDLPALVKQLAGQLELTPQLRLSESLAWNENGRYRQVVRPVWEIGRALQFFPEQSIELALRPDLSDATAEMLRQQLWYSLYASGLDEGQYKIRSRARGRSWQGSGPVQYRLR